MSNGTNSTNNDPRRMLRAPDKRISLASISIGGSSQARETSLET
jgi:hypothetical protein